MKDKISITFVAIASAILGSMCCIGPILAGVAGLGPGVFFAKFSTYRPMFLLFSAIALGYGFYSAYFKKPKVECRDGECKVKIQSKASKVALWVITIFVIFAFAFPYLNPSIISRSFVSSTVKVGKVEKIIIKISSLDCEACFIPMRSVLEKKNGILKMIPDFEHRELYMEFDPDRVKLIEIVNLIEGIGFKVDKIKLTREK